MANLDHVVLGINHMFLYPESMVNANVHTNTLGIISDNELLDALDCWVWASHSREELRILKNCGKQINYNIGDRFGEKPIFPATNDAKERAYSLDILRRESDFAVECGAKKIILGSGRDVPENREDAKKRFVELMHEWIEYVPSDITIALEPVDRDIDKCALLGTPEDTNECVFKLHEAGCKNVGILLDMGHIPIMYETLESAVLKMGPQLCHIHLGNCIMKNRENPLYGDKHPCWGAEDGEYDEADGVHFIQLLKDAGYLSHGHDQTISFEMRPLIGMDSLQTVEHLTKWFHTTMQTIR